MESPPQSRPAAPAPTRRRIAYLRSGLYAAAPPALPDASTPVGAILAERRRALLDDLGGEEAASTAQRLLVDLAVRQLALLEAVDGYLLGLPSLVDKRHRRAWQVVLDRCRLAAQLEGTLARLGLERRAKPVLDLAAQFARMHAERAAAGQDEDDDEREPDDPEAEPAPEPAAEAATGGAGTP